jgi:hypothetical protein
MWGVQPRPVRVADNLTAISEPTIKAMWDPQHLSTLQAYTACYENSVTYLYIDDFRTSQETRASTTCYGIALPLHM